MNDSPIPTIPQRRDTLYTASCFVLLIVAIQLVIGPKLKLSQWGLARDDNPGVAEGQAWLEGHLDIDRRPNVDQSQPGYRMHDSAYFKGRVYNVFPPILPALTCLFAPFHRLLIGRTDVWLPGTYVFAVFWPLVAAAFFLFKREVRDPAWAALLTLGYMGGTALYPNLAYARSGHLGQTHHVISQIGLLILLLDLLGRQRIWPAMLGLLIASWSRQMTILYALPIAWFAWKRGRLWTIFAPGIVVIVAPLLLLNYLKFGNPLDFGYAYIYVGRHEDMADRAAAHGLFSWHFLAESFRYTWLAPPSIDISLTSIRVRERSAMGTSMWLTTPLLFLILVPAWWKDSKRRLLMLGSLPVVLGVLCYHSPGFMQHGYSRFSLDFLPVWLAVLSPQSAVGRWKWFTIAAIACSLLYFQALEF